MACRDLQFEQGGIYHLYNRSTERIAIFRCTADYHYFISRMFFLAEEEKISLQAWSLLPTHYHIMAEQLGDATISHFIMRLCNSYGKHFNIEYERQGRLFGQRFKAKVINDPSYLSRVSVYIENNAIHHQLVDTMNDWHYSSLHWPNDPVIFRTIKNDSNELEEMELLI